MNKTVLITGATSGIGKETALLLASKGFLVYGTARNVEGKNLPFRLLPMDVRNETSIKEAVQQILTEVGRIDILINNAGVGVTGAVEEIPAEQLHNVFATNLYGAIASPPSNARSGKRTYHQYCIYCRLYGLAFSWGLFSQQRRSPPDE